jgi:hypothetical protein
MTELIAQSLIVLSVLSIFYIFWQERKKVCYLPEKDINWPRGKRAWQSIRKTGLIIRDVLEIFLQKVLSRIRLVFLKTENAISSCQERIRENRNKRKPK